MPDNRDSIRLRWAAVGVLAVTEIGLVGCLLGGHTDSGLLIGTIIAVAALLVVTVRASDVALPGVNSRPGRGELETPAPSARRDR